MLNKYLLNERIMLKSTYCTPTKALTFCLLSAHLFRAFGFRLKEAVRTFENFFPEGARIYSVISALGTSLLPTSMGIPFRFRGLSGST